jgi:hypothetical protein
MWLMPAHCAVLVLCARSGARVIDIDVETASTAELTAALANIDVVLSTVGVNLLKDGQLKLVAASKAAGVRRFLPSEFGFDMAAVGRGGPVAPWDYKLDVQEAVKQAGLEYTFVEAGIFGEYLLPFAGIDVASRTLTVPGSLDTRVSISPLADVGKQVADLIVSGRGRNSTVFLSTADYSWAELHAALEKATGAPWTKKIKSAAQYDADAAANEQDWVARVSLIMLRGKGASFPLKDSYAHQHGIALGDFDDFLRNALAAK